MLVCLVHLGNYADKHTVFYKISIYGKYGVQLFFVMSAFTMCISISRHKEFSLNNYIQFLLKRLFRIAPMYYLAIICYGLYSFLLHSNFGQIPYWSNPDIYTLKNIFTNVFLVHGFYYPSNNNIVPGGWSIGCEFIFYVIFPLLFFRIINSKKLTIFVIISSILISSQTPYIFNLLGYYTVTNKYSFSYYFIANQIPCFLIGMVYYKNQYKRTCRVFMLAMIPIFVIILSMTELKTYAWILNPIIASLLAVSMAYLLNGRKIPKFIKIIGECSFSIYLIHFVFIWIAAKLCIWKLPEVLDTSLLLILLYVLIFGITFFFAKLSYKYIEIPFINLGYGLTKLINKDIHRK